MAREIIPGIYKISCIANEKVYIGMSNDIHNRWLTHLNEIPQTSGKRRGLRDDLIKYRKKGFRFEVLEVEENPGDRATKEIHYINLHKSNLREFGYNKLSRLDSETPEDVTGSELTQVAFRVPKDIWDEVGDIAKKRNDKGEPIDTKRAIVAEALEDYCKKNRVKK